MSKIKVKYIDHMGTDDSVVNAARLSMDKKANDYTDEQNLSLINYLSIGQSSKVTKQDVNYLASGLATEEEVRRLLVSYKNRSTHWTPFAHTCISVMCTAPVPIRTQAFKHKQGLVENEESRRYITTTPEIFIPEHFRNKASNVKQGSTGIHTNSTEWLNEYLSQVEMNVRMYSDMIENGVAPEQARLVLPQGCMVNWQWTGNLYAFANFYNSRTDSHAQKEIQDLAYLIGDIIQPLFPVSWSALTKKEI